jgi:hypothetical protein
LGGSDKVLDLYRKGLEGHLLQYKELRTVKTELATDGAYHKEFITMSDWFHTGEGMRGFLLWGFSEPTNPALVLRMKRFAGMYMNEDPEAPNYDPAKKMIKSIWTGSKGPMMRKATTYDWVGDPVPGTFHLLHNEAGTSKMLNLMEWYPRMRPLRGVSGLCGRQSPQHGSHPTQLERLRTHARRKISQLDSRIYERLERAN